MPTEKTDGRRGSLRGINPKASTNAGLWLDRFMNRGDGDAPVRNLIEKVLESIRQPEGYARAFDRHRTALESLDGGVEEGVTRLWTGGVQGRMIVGIGAASVRETGISLLRTWGLPFIPGSALKGIAASMTTHRAGNVWSPGAPGYRALFGDHLLSGCVVFHDAWWIPEASKVPLDLDVMTVHHRDYYGEGTEAPCDWDEPAPVAFITARGSYLVALSGPASWVDAAGTLLKAGLTELGVGAKTAAGYGRVKLDPKLTKSEEARELKKQERIKKEESLSQVVARFKGASNANDIVKDLLKAQREENDPEVIRATAANLWRKDPKFWKGWRKKTRTAEELALIQDPDAPPQS